MANQQIDLHALWQYYQRGYRTLVRNGIYFRKLVRPALSHVYFQRAVPVLADYARAKDGQESLPPEFGDRMQECSLTARDLLHLDYAICLGYAELQGQDPRVLAALPVLEWPGPPGSGLFAIGSDVVSEMSDTEYFDEYETDDNSDDSDDPHEPTPPYDS